MGNVCECRPRTGTPGADVLQQNNGNCLNGVEAAKQVTQVTEEDLNSNASDADDDVVDDLPKPSARYPAKTRQSVSAEAYGEWNKRKDFKAPVHAKSPEQKERIQKILENCFLFSCLDVEDLEVVLGAFSEERISEGTMFIKQGDDGFKMYLIEEGEATVYKRLGDSSVAKGEEVKTVGNGVSSGDGGGTVSKGEVSGFPERKNLTPAEKSLLEAGFRLVNVMKEGDAVGELALMYNAPRAASVVAASDLKLWSLDRETFGHIVRDAAARKRALFEEALQDVPLLRDVDPYERSKIADALKTANYEAGDIIIREGDEGDTFYLLLEGTAEALKAEKAVFRYSKGGHFGELALLRSQPRAATVKATSACRIAYMDRKSFKRLLGPLEGLLARDREHYRKVMQELGMDTKYLDN